MTGLNQLSEQRKTVTIYTDGSCLGNPGPGGYGTVLLYGDGNGPNRKELSGGYRLTTNNRMEIMAVIEGLKALKEPCRVLVLSDSQYVVKTISLGWAHRWKAKNWMMKPTRPRPNADLWKCLLALCELHEVEITWVKGHNGNLENERCDALAVAASNMENSPPDDGFKDDQARVPAPDLTGE